MGTFGGQRRVSDIELHDRTTGPNRERYMAVWLQRDSIDYLRSSIVSLGGWQNVGEVKPDSPLVYDVTDLTTKKEYKFRVKAVSKIGPSEPTPLAKTVLAKDPWGIYLFIY